jgi:hypothetical protein
VTLVSLAIAVPLSILVIAFAWLTFRPLIGCSLQISCASSACHCTGKSRLSAIIAA